jgi:elongation factor G
MQTRPIISAAIRAKDKDTRDSLQHVLTDLAQRLGNISIIAGTNENQIILGAMGERDLKAVCRILRAGRLKVDIGEPRVIYLETIRNQAEGAGKYIKQTEGRGNYGHVKLRLEPLERGHGYQFIDEIRDGVIPTNYIQAIQGGIEEARLKGLLAGNEIVDFKATLYDGSYHDMDSNEMAFKIAASSAFKEAALSAGPIVLEPMMSLEVTTSQDYVDVIVRDLRLRRGQIQTAEHGLIHAIVPLAEMLGYAKDLESSTNGLAECLIRFAHYSKLPDGEQPGNDEAGITANKPSGPKPKHSSAAADLDFE